MDGLSHIDRLGTKTSNEYVLLLWFLIEAWCLSGDFDASRISNTFDGDSGDVVGGLAWQPTHQGAKVLLACGARKQGAALDLFGGLEEYMFMS